MTFLGLRLNTSVLLEIEPRIVLAKPGELVLPRESQKNWNSAWAGNNSGDQNTNYLGGDQLYSFPPLPPLRLALFWNSGYL